MPKHNTPCIQDKEVALLKERVSTLGKRQDKTDDLIKEQSKAITENTIATKEQTIHLKNLTKTFDKTDDKVDKVDEKVDNSEKNTDKSSNKLLWLFLTSFFSIIVTVIAFIVTRVIDLI